MRNKVLCKVTSEEDKQKIKQQIEACQPLLRLIYECCLDDYEKAEKVNDEDFKNPNWAYEQAYKIGLKKGLTKLLDYVIINLNKEK